MKVGCLYFPHRIIFAHLEPYDIRKPEAMYGAVVEAGALLLYKAQKGNQ